MLPLFGAMLAPLKMEMMRQLLCRAGGGMSWKRGGHMALGLCTLNAQKVLASVIVPHLKRLQGEERFFLGGMEISVLCSLWELFQVLKQPSSFCPIHRLFLKDWFRQMGKKPVA